jgi:hypothetical protein
MKEGKPANEEGIMKFTGDLPATSARAGLSLSRICPKTAPGKALKRVLTEVEREPYT